MSDALRDGFIAIDSDEGDDFVHARWSAHATCTAQLQAHVDAVLDSLNQHAFTGIAQFLRRSAQHMQRSWSCASGAPSYADLPVAIVQADCSAADHAIQMQQLIRHLQRRCSRHVALLRSRECTSLASAVRSLVAQVMGSREQVATSCTYDFSVLAGWHADQQTRRATAQAASATGPGSQSSRQQPEQPHPQPPSHAPPPLVVIVEDCERFSPAVLNGLLRACSDARCVDGESPLPLAFVLTLYNGAETLPQLLQRGTLVQLRAHRFTLCSTEQSIEQLMAQLVASPTLPCLSATGYELALRLLAEEHGSTSAFVCQLRFCFLRHFRTSPTSFLSALDVLSYADAEAQLGAISAGLGHTQLAALLKMPSVAAQLRGVSSEAKREEAVLAALPAWLVSQSCARHAGAVARRCLIDLLSRTYRGGNKHHLSARRIYADFASGKVSVGRAAELGAAALLDGKLEETELRRWLQRCADVLEEVPAGAGAQLEEAQERLSRVLETADCVERPSLSTVSSTSQAAPSTSWSASKRRRTQLAGIQAVAQPGRSSIRCAAAEWLQHLLRQHADRAMTLPLHEVWECAPEEEADMLNAFSASTRESLNSALQATTRAASASRASSRMTQTTTSTATRSRRQGGAANPASGNAKPDRANTAPVCAQEKSTTATLSATEDLTDGSGLPSGWTAAVLSMLMAERNEKWQSANALLESFVTHPLTQRSKLSRRALLAHFVLAVQQLRVIGWAKPSNGARGMLCRLV